MTELNSESNRTAVTLLSELLQNYYMVKPLSKHPTGLTVNSSSIKIYKFIGLHTNSFEFVHS